MSEFIAKLAEETNLPFPSCIWLFLFTSIPFYLLIVRGILGYMVIKKVKRTKKERKAHQAALRNRTAKERWRAIGKWFLCLGYIDEQKGEGFFLFFLYCWIYCLTFIGYLIFGGLAFFVSAWQPWCGVVLRTKIVIVDFPVMLLTALLWMINAIVNKKWKG